MYVIKNAMIVAMDPKRSFYRAGNIWMDGDRIVKIGPAHEVGLPDCQYESFDATDMIAIPGFVSVHTDVVTRQGWLHHKCRCFPSSEKNG